MPPTAGEKTRQVFGDLSGLAFTRVRTPATRPCHAGRDLRLACGRSTVQRMPPTAGERPDRSAETCLVWHLPVPEPQRHAGVTPGVTYAWPAAAVRCIECTLRLLAFTRVRTPATRRCHARRDLRLACGRSTVHRMHPTAGEKTRQVFGDLSGLAFTRVRPPATRPCHARRDLRLACGSSTVQRMPPYG
jgi:hypothetical protein